MVVHLLMIMFPKVTTIQVKVGMHGKDKYHFIFCLKDNPTKMVDMYMYIRINFVCKESIITTVSNKRISIRSMYSLMICRTLQCGFFLRFLQTALSGINEVNPTTIV